MPRLRDLGLSIGELCPGDRNAITDVPGVRVGHSTIVTGDGPLIVGRGPVRTGVTVIFPREEAAWSAPAFAGIHRLNGNGELTGSHWVQESGILTSAIGLTNTHSVGVVRDGLVKADYSQRPTGTNFWSLPVVGETWDGFLNDINGMHVTVDHVLAAVASASVDDVSEGNVGGGTGMICHQFKGGIGTSSRVLPKKHGGWTVGVLVQANHGRRSRLSMNGLPIGSVITDAEVPVPKFDEMHAPEAELPEGSGSIIVVVATDAPLIPTQCERLAQRAGLGIARVGGVGENYSGDIFIAFATGNKALPIHDAVPHPLETTIIMVPNHWITPLFDAVIEATEEAIWNALLAAETTVGRDGVTVHALEPELLLAAVHKLSPRLQ